MCWKFLCLVSAVVLISACAQDQTMTDETGGQGATQQIAAPTTPNTGSSVGSKPVESSATGSGPTPTAKENFVMDVGDRVFFAYDRSDLTPDSQATLDRQVVWLQKYRGTMVTIEGHCDERGTRNYNLALGNRRAHAVRDYLIASGIDPNRLNTKSYGKERPVAFGSDEASWAQNRRAVSVIH